MVEGFVLPKVISFAAEDSICFVRGDAFEAIHEARNGNMWRDQQMDMVGHDDKSVQVVEAQLCFTEKDGVHHTAGNAGIFQP